MNDSKTIYSCVTGREVKHQEIYKNEDKISRAAPITSSSQFVGLWRPSNCSTVHLYHRIVAANVEFESKR